MGKLDRAIFALFIVVAVLASASTQPAAALTQSIAVAAMPCCDDDCPDNPSCDMACMTMVRCASGPTALVPATTAAMVHTMVQVALAVPDPPLMVMGEHPEGLKRPPRF